ncbi:hypothetical protein K493DRAFT_313539, partial [Basidiobolus meristosporus CBS 931.73]
MQIAPTDSAAFIGGQALPLTRSDRRTFEYTRNLPAPAPVHTNRRGPSLSHIPPSVVPSQEQPISQTAELPVVRIRHKRSISFSSGSAAPRMNGSLSSGKSTIPLPGPRAVQPRPTVTALP